MPATNRRWTKTLVQSLPSGGNHYELVAGELLVTSSPSARHQTVHWRLTLLLVDYLRPLGLHQTMRDVAADISWTKDDLVQPDIFNVAPEGRSLYWRTYRRLRLVVEVLSLNSRRGDRVLQRRLYKEHGVETYRVVDPDGRTVEVWHPGDAEGATVSEVLTCQFTSESPVLRIPPATIFDALRLRCDRLQGAGTARMSPWNLPPLPPPDTRHLTPDT